MAPPAQPRFRRLPPGLYAGAVVSGMGTVLTGAVLPGLSRLQHLNDRGAGVLLAAQFLGGFLGGMTVLSPPQRSLRGGALCSLLALSGASLALLAGLPAWAFHACLLAFGFGLGQLITAANLIVGQEDKATRAAHLSVVNLLWSLGAVLSPLGIVSIARRLPLWGVFAGFCLVLAAVWVSLLRAHWPQAPKLTQAQRPSAAQAGTWALFAGFAALFFLYGGTENSLSGWMSTYALRYGGATGVTAPLMTAAVWAGIDAGRAVCAVVLRHVDELRAVRVTLCVFVLCALALQRAGSVVQMLGLALAMGLCLAPVFPAALSVAMERGLPQRQLGAVMAMCGLGAAAVPFVVGAVSFQAGSLRVAMALPAVSAALMVLVLLRVRVPHPHEAPQG
jgi:fucose permease